MHQPHKHIIVGGGFGGLRAARLMANRDDIAVTVINPQNNFEYHGSLYRSANGYSPLETVIPYREIFQDTNIRYHQDFMVDIDPSHKRIKLLSGQEMHYDSATLALGYEPAYFGIPGMREFSKTLYSLADALALRTALAALAERHFHKSAPARVIVVGGGPTGVETAVSIPRFFELITGDRRVAVTLIEAQDRILGGLSEEFSARVTKALADRVEIRCGLKVIRASKTSLYIADNPTQEFDLLIWTAGSSANGYFRQRSDLFEVDRGGRAVLDAHLQTKHDGLYVAGDSAAVAFSGTATAAIEMGGYIAQDIIAKLQGQETASFQMSLPNYAVPTGHQSAVAMQEGIILTDEEGWQVRRDLDLHVLSLIAPEDVAQAHWQKGENLASLFESHTRHQ